MRKAEFRSTGERSFGRTRMLILGLTLILTTGLITTFAVGGPAALMASVFGEATVAAAAEMPNAVETAKVDPTPEPEPPPVEDPRIKYGPSKIRLSYEYWGPFDYENFLEREKAGLVPAQDGPVFGESPYNFLINNDGGATGTGFFTQSETSLVAFGNTVIIGFNDSGSNAAASNKFTGWSRSTDGGATFTDGGTLPTNAGGDAGDPVLGRDDVTGRIYFSTLGFSTSTIQVFRSDDNGATWQPPVNGTPGGNNEDKQWLAVDNFPGAGQGNVYLMSRRFGNTGAGPGIYMFRSTDGGATFGPNLGVQITPGAQGAYVTVGPDHAVYAFWYAGTSIQMRKSTDFGLTFGAPVTVSPGLVGGVNGDMGFTGIRQGTATPAGFRSSQFPHVAVNPVSGHIYVVHANDAPGSDKADIFFVQSTNGGATWSAPVRVNDDATTTDQWMPTIAVSTDGTRVGFFYYSRQEDTANNNLFRYWGRIGLISGATVTLQPSFAISDVPSLPEMGRDSLINSVYMSDYDQAVATPGAFHVIWSDNRDDLVGGAGRKNPNVYYKKIPLGLAVSTTVPAINSILNTQPTIYTVNFTDPIDAATVSASDFTVNGIPASSFVVNDADTVTFTFGVTPVVNQGVQTMAMAAGSVTRAGDGSPLVEFTGTFRYDATPLNVISTSPPFPNGTFTLPGPFAYDVTFNEPINPASITTSDLALSGIAGASVTGVTVLPGNITARFTIDVATEGTLTASIAAGAVADAFGNPGNAFSASYGVDIGTVPYPVPLAAKQPLGSLIYDPNATGTINFAGDTDNFTINLDPNQTISIIVRPTSASLQPKVEVFDPGNTSLGFASAGAPNQNTGFQTLAISSPGTYRMEISGVGGTTGNYSVQVILNAAFELEGVTPSGNNNTVAGAQNINSSFLSLSTPLHTALRGAVSGRSDSAVYSAAAVPFGFEDIEATGTVIAGLTGDDAAVSVPIGFSFPFYGSNQTSVFVSTNGLMTFGTSNTSFTNADLTTSPTQAAIAPLWDDQHTAGGTATSGVRRQVFDAGGPNERLVIQWNKVRFFAGGTTNPITYQAVLYKDGRIRFNYLDLVNGVANDNGASATVGVKAAGSQGNDRLLLAFNNGPNAFVGTGQSTLISPPSPTPDYYAFTAAAGDVVTVGAKSAGLSPVQVELRNAADAVLATGVAADNLDSVVNNFAVPGAGTYYLRVIGAVALDYNVVVTRNAAFDTEANDSFAAPQTLDGNRSALGAIVGVSQYEASNPAPTFDDITLSGGVIVPGLTNQDDASVSVPIGFSFPFFGAGNSDVFVSSNGLLSFGGANTAFTNTDMTASPATAAIAVFWDDQHTDGGVAGSGVYTKVEGVGNDQHITIQWNKVRFFSGGVAGDTITYQAKLYADGRIQVNYLDLVSGTATRNNGAEATLGVKAAGAQGPNRLLLAFNNGPNSFIGTGVSTLISQPPGEDWYSFTVGSNQNLVEIATSTPADGPGEFVNNLDPGIELYDPSGALVASGTDTDGRNESIVASGLTAAGTYRVRVTGDNDTVGEYFLSTRVRTETTETLTVTPNPVQYSDVATFTATLSPATANGEVPATQVTFYLNGANIGTANLVANAGVLTGTLNHQVLLPAGSYSVLADFNATDPDFVVVDPTTTLVVNREDTNVVLAQAYPFSVQVNNAGGTAGPITRCVNITDVDSSLGDIDLATVSVSVSAVGPGPSPTVSAVTYDANTADNTLQACVTFSNVAVNVYDITFTVTGNYYQGERHYVLVIFDPSLGFITGGGRVLNPNTGNEINFGINGKYLKNGNSKGNLLVVEHTPTGDIVLKSNAIQSLSMAGEATAILIGKATLNGVGNHSFRAVVQDNGEPGTGDKFGLQVTSPGGALVPSLTFDLRTILGGNIQVPHTPKR